MRTYVHSPPDALSEAAQSLAQVVTIRDNSGAAGVARAPKRSATASRTAALTVERAKVARQEVPDRNHRARQFVERGDPRTRDVKRRSRCVLRHRSPAQIDVLLLDLRQFLYLIRLCALAGSVAAFCLSIVELGLRSRWLSARPPESWPAPRAWPLRLNSEAGLPPVRRPAASRRRHASAQPPLRRPSALRQPSALPRLHDRHCARVFLVLD